MWLLDTNVISELRIPDRSHKAVRAWSLQQDPEQFFISVSTVLEVQYGALLLQHRDKVQGAMFTSWVQERVLTDFSGRILPTTVEIALVCAGLHVPNRRGERDALIAATALVHGLTVVTRNTRDFEGTGVKLFNPWEAAR
ncbi:type II toxin-antitoxin system VapC family toxin [Mesorhizobium sp. LHD-90]|uniref:type II toxin-antitoxin system VapC family toxin n=1 Tax=Mesorhizobium sp. LHD-90 TaxID=3071414 RepID=UPI0027DF89B3|nr:type II toxin-antitoxin system VapC family toxin [Mesorhizobium sp. LHD-90]MDQ6436746.1 type II toxin-antitoxin system VapC family toxin [Mesorhizobium sp. LHD-90]